MKFEQIKALIFDNIHAAFDELDRRDWGPQRGSYQHLKQEFIDQPLGYSEPKLQNRLIQLVTLLDSPEHNTKEPRLLTPPPFIPELFLGREADLDAVYHKLFHEEHLLLLVNGQGGIGKTTLAAKYWERYKSHYSHVAWVFAGDDLAQALLTLAPKLNLSFPETMPNPERLLQLIQELSALNKPCLLIIDNANNLAELEKNYRALSSCDNFHILLTSRLTEFEQAARFYIQTLEKDVTIELFQQYYPKYQTSDEALLLQIFSAVGYNTLVIELLAKNLRNLNKLREQYTLEDLLVDLQHKGLLDISKSSNVNIIYQAQGTALRQANPEAIISAMYELGELTEEEKRLLSVFAVLPAEQIKLELLELLQPGAELDDPLSHLVHLGWLDFAEQEVSFKVSPVIQQIVRVQNKARLKADCQTLIYYLTKQLDWEIYGHYSDYHLMDELTNYATSLIACFQDLDNDLAGLCQLVADYYRVTGNLHASMQYFELGHSMREQLFKNYPGEVYYKHSLAISYERLGVIHMELVNLPQALSYFDQETALFKELYELYPQTVGYKYCLAISYEKSGEINRELGNLPQALSYFGLSLELSIELYKLYPQIASYKYGLAISYSKVGEINRELGNLLQALSYFELSLELSKELYESHPQNMGYKYCLAVSYQQLGEIYLKLGNLPQALNYFEFDLALSKELYGAYSQNVAYKNSLAISYANLGDIYFELDNLPQALNYFDQETALFKELYESYPQNIGYKNNLAVSYAKLGMIHLQQNNLSQAIQAFDHHHSLEAEVYQAAPENVNHHHNYAESLAVSAVLHKLEGLDASSELNMAAHHMQTLYQKTNRDYHLKKLALIHQMQAAEGDALKELIIALVKS